MGRASGRIVKSKFRLCAPILFTAALFLMAQGCGSVPPKVKSHGTLPAKSGSAKLGKMILNTAESQIGTRYRFGGRSPKKGFDCSGFAWWTLKQNGIDIPRMSKDQYKVGRKIPEDELRAGDLVFFTTYRKGASHVGIYDGKGRFVHAPSSGGKVSRTRLSMKYWQKRYLGARRVY